MEAIYIFAAIFLAIGGVCILLALWGRDPKHFGSAVGTLADSKRVMRRESRYSEKKVPVTTSVYLYEVNGKTYRLRREGSFGRSTLLRRVTVVYLKGFPRFGFLEKFPFLSFLIGGILLISYGAVTLWKLY